MKAATEGAYLSFMEFFGGGVYEAHDVCLPLKILNIGWSVLILLALSCYTANLAAFLTKTEFGSYWDSMEKARGWMWTTASCRAACHAAAWPRGRDGASSTQ